MAACKQIIGYLDELLDPTAYDDYGPNGLQVPGSEQIQTVVTGVSANADLFAGAREENADLVLVHHGLFWAGPPHGLDRASKRRLQLLFDADLALAAFARRPFVRSQGLFTQIKLRLSETRAIRSERIKQAGGTQLRWPFT